MLIPLKVGDVIQAGTTAPRIAVAQRPNGFITVVNMHDPAFSLNVLPQVVERLKIRTAPKDEVKRFLAMHASAVQKQQEAQRKIEMTKTTQKLAVAMKPIVNPRGGLAVTPPETPPTPMPAKPLLSVKPGGLQPLSEKLVAAGQKKRNDNLTSAGKHAEATEAVFPENEFDRAAWEEVIKGGGKDEIAARIVKRFQAEPDMLKRKYRTNPANYIRYHDAYVKEVTEAGLIHAKPAPAKAAKTGKAKPAAKLKNGTLQWAVCRQGAARQRSQPHPVSRQY